MKRWLFPSVGLLTTTLLAYGCSKIESKEPPGENGGTSGSGPESSGKSSGGDSGETSSDSGGTSSDSGGTAGSGGASTDEGGAAGAAGAVGALGGESSGGANGSSGTSSTSDGTCPGSETTFKAGTVVWEEDFEGTAPDWSVTGGVWAVGKPTHTSGPAAFSGKQVAGTGLTSDYDNSKSAYLSSPEIKVPAAKTHPRLRFDYWYELAAGDAGYVVIRVDGGNWQTLSTLRQSGDGAWRQMVLNLGEWADHTVQLGFELSSNGSATAPGFFIDDVIYETGAQDFASQQDFEGAWDYWSATNGVWAFGAPTAPDGPAPIDGKALAGTILSGDYQNSTSAWLASPVIDVPAAKKDPHVSFKYWYELASGDAGYVALSVDGGNWQTVTTLRGSGDGQWYNFDLPLGAYANRQVQLGFELSSNGAATAPGFYVDDVHYETCLPALVSPEGFENGWAGWSAYGGVWAVGEPTAAGGPSPHSGKAVAGTVLSGDYESSTDAYLASPRFLISKDSKTPGMSYWYWYDLAAGDRAYFVISVDGGNWQTLDTLADSGGDIWRQKKVDLTPYKDHYVQVGYQLSANGAANSLGYYIDDVTFNLK